MPHRRLGNYLRRPRAVSPLVILILILWPCVFLYEWDPLRGDHLHIEREMVIVGIMVTLSVLAMILWLRERQGDSVTEESEHLNAVRDEILGRLDEQTEVLRDAAEGSADAVRMLLAWMRGPEAVPDDKESS